MTFFLTVVLALAAACARAAPLARRDCASVPGPDPNVVNEIYKIGLQRGINDKTMLVMFCTAVTESDVNNLPCGDQDSLGVFQQRPSQDWGTPAQLMNVTYSTNAFLNVAIPLEAQNPNTDAGVIAQMVQNAQAGNRYTANEGTALQLIAQAKAAVGGSAPAPAPPPPAPSATSGGSGGAGNVESGPSAQPPAASAAPGDNDGGDCELPENCVQTYTPVPGDDCDGVSSMFGISLQHFYDMNPEIDSQCFNLQVTQPYCVKLSTD